jgi:xanthine dehydrogenase YagR molybdenum-binding subunit
MSVVGTPQPRIDGPLKVTGRATYAADAPAQNLAYGVVICGTIVKGSIKSIDTTAAGAVPGVQLILTHENCPKFQSPASPVESQGQSLRPLQTADIEYYGQHVAVVVADSFEAATAAAELVKIAYLPAGAALGFAISKRVRPAANGSREKSWGDPSSALAKSAVKIVQRYTTPYMHHNPMEPPSTTASWTGDQLTIHDQTQSIAGVLKTVAATLGIAANKIRITSPFVGGSFGAKRVTWPHVYLAAVAAKLVGRPVRLVLNRSQMYTTIGYRPQTIQEVTLASNKKGELQVLRHVATTTTSQFDNFVEPASAKPGMMYACANGELSRMLSKVDLGTPTTMRAPGEATGFFALESAMDELAHALNTDPLSLRLLNHADKDPTNGLPWSSKSLKECYAQGAEKFGWKGRKLNPGTMRAGPWLIGWGMASAAYPANRSPAAASVQFSADGSCVVATGTHEMGGGTYTSLAAIVADVLGLGISKVSVQLGDSELPATTVSGGSRTINSVGPAVEAAAMQLLDKLVSFAISDPESPLHGAEAGEIIASKGALRLKTKPSRADPLEKVLERQKVPSLTMMAHTAPSAAAAKYSPYAFGAHFAEVRVDPMLGEVRVSRYVGAFAAGTIINPLAARSQLIGGIIGGIGMALQEESPVDPAIGTFMTRNLVDYRIAVNADIPEIDIILVPEHDNVTSPLGTKGVGELGIVGTAAAIANAVFHATGKRIRDLPITPERILT